MLYREFQGEGCGKKHGYVWALRNPKAVGEDPVKFLQADAHPENDHVEALQEAAEHLGVEPRAIKIKGVN